MEQIQVTGPTHRCNGVNDAERHGTANRCTVCGEYRNGYYNAGGMEILVPQNDSVNGIHSPLPWTVEIHDARGDYARIALVSRSSHFECGYYIVAVDDMAIRREQVIKDFKFIASTVNARADSVSPSACQKCWEHEEREAAVCPEDVGCIEYIGILERQRDSLVKTLEGRAALEMECLNEAGMEIDSLRAVVGELEAALQRILNIKVGDSPHLHAGFRIDQIGEVARAALTKVQAEKNSG